MTISRKYTFIYLIISSFKEKDVKMMDGAKKGKEHMDRNRNKVDDVE